LLLKTFKNLFFAHSTQLPYSSLYQLLCIHENTNP